MPVDHSTCVPLREHEAALRAANKEYVEALRAADQRALELLAKSSADRIKTNMVVASLLVSVVSVLIAIAAVLKSVPK